MRELDRTAQTSDETTWVVYECHPTGKAWTPCCKKCKHILHTDQDKCKSCGRTVVEKPLQTTNDLYPKRTMDSNDVKMAPMMEPLMNDRSVNFMVDAVAFKRWGETVFEGRTPLKTALQFGIEEARDFYEAFITDGTLMVVKTATITEATDYEWYSTFGNCSACKTMLHGDSKFCPGCGAKVIE